MDKLTWPETKERMRKAMQATDASRRKERNSECCNLFQYVTYTLSKSPLPFSSFPIFAVERVSQRLYV